MLRGELRYVATATSNNVRNIIGKLLGGLNCHQKYEQTNASIMNKIYELFNCRSILLISEWPLLCLNSVARARIIDKSATNVSAREVGSRHERKGERDNSLRGQFQTIYTIFVTQ